VVTFRKAHLPPGLKRPETSFSSSVPCRISHTARSLRRALNLFSCHFSRVSLGQTSTNFLFCGSPVNFLHVSETKRPHLVLRPKLRTSKSTR